MDKQATDFALMAGAFSKDERMARQVCRLLADGDVNEATARTLLKLVSDGKLASEIVHQPWYVYSGSSTVSVPYTTTTTSTFNTDCVYDGSLKAMATSQFEDEDAHWRLN